MLKGLLYRLIELCKCISLLVIPLVWIFDELTDKRDFVCMDTVWECFFMIESIDVDDVDWCNRIVFLLKSSLINVDSIANGYDR